VLALGVGFLASAALLGPAGDTGARRGVPWPPQASTHTPPAIKQGSSSPSPGAEQEGLPFRRRLHSPATASLAGGDDKDPIAF
jgi:hypothetical protein